MVVRDLACHVISLNAGCLWVTPSAIPGLHGIMSLVAIARGLKFDEKNAILKGSLEYSEVAHNLWISARVI